MLLPRETQTPCHRSHHYLTQLLVTESRGENYFLCSSKPWHSVQALTGQIRSPSDLKKSLSKPKALFFRTFERLPGTSGDFCNCLEVCISLYTLGSLCCIEISA
ncbi:hypothetical protein CEXT_130071 [Caerostris extrusa]|uniref:Uncharacterized protein n=1 Tax=Caerostris extrusa TaxID=172846 RepID=A0AAV4QXE9_CAEEX|nr:hypothetical protein CEXT_130071 [Caerostris extrusa]